jgi:hypothetical protein
MMRSFEATHRQVTLVLGFGFPGQPQAKTAELECGWIDPSIVPAVVPTIPPEGWPGIDTSGAEPLSPAPTPGASAP